MGSPRATQLPEVAGLATGRNPSGEPQPFLVLRSDHFADNKLVALLAITATLTQIQSLRVEGARRMIGRIAGAELRTVERAIAVYLGFAEVAGRAA